MVSRRQYQSRLERKKQQSQWRQAVFWMFLTGLVLAGLYFWGLPLFIKIAVMYGDWKSGDTTVVADDQVPPAPPRMEIPFTATNSATMNLMGFSEPGAEVEIFLNQHSVKKVTADADGKFLASNVELDSGYNWFSAMAKDEAQNTSAESQRELVVYDNKPPNLSLEKPQTGNKFYGSEQKRVEVRGTTDEDARVKVNDRSVIVDQNGTFYTFIELQDGENVIRVVASDESGNETVEEVKVTYNP